MNRENNEASSSGSCPLLTPAELSKRRQTLLTVLNVLLTLLGTINSALAQLHNIYALLSVHHQHQKTEKWSNIKKWRHKVKERKIRQPSVGKRVQPKRKSLGPLTSPDFDCYEETGLFLTQFERIFKQVGPLIVLPRDGAKTSRPVPTTLSPRARLCLVLNYFKEGGRYRRISRIYGVSKSYISRELYHIVPKLYCTLNEISWPDVWTPHSFEGVSAALDCTPHYRDRVHPGSSNWYRGDKHAHFYNVQLVVSLQGVLLDVKIVLGHNNDKGTFKITETHQKMDQLQLKWLADGGYGYHRLVTPDDRRSKEWNNTQKSLRSIVEVVAGLAKNYAICRDQFGGNPELQEMIIMSVYQLTNINLKEYPLRLHIKLPGQ